MRRTTPRHRAMARAVAMGFVVPALVIGSQGAAHAGLLDGGLLDDLLGGTPCVPLPGVEDCDTTPPETTIDSVSPALVDGTSTSSRVVFAFSAVDDRSESRLSFECRLVTPDSADPAWTPCDRETGAAYDVPDAPTAAYRFEVRASDDAVTLPGRPAPNTETTPETLSFGVDTTPPQTLRFSAPEFYEPSRTARFLHGTSEAGTSYLCRLDGRPLDCPEDFLRVTGLASGRHRLSVAAVDSVGNADATPATTTWWVPRARIGTRAERARWTRTRQQGAFGGDLQTTSTRRAALSATVRRARTIGVVLGQGRGYGRVLVRFDRSRLGVVDLADRRASTRTVTFDLPGRAARNGTVRIVPLDRGRTVAVDAFFAS